MGVWVHGSMLLNKGKGGGGTRKEFSGPKLFFIFMIFRIRIKRKIYFNRQHSRNFLL